MPIARRTRRWVSISPTSACSRKFKVAGRLCARSLHGNVYGLRGERFSYLEVYDRFPMQSLQGKCQTAPSLLHLFSVRN